MKRLLLIFVAYGDNIGNSFGNIEFNVGVFPPTYNLIKEAEMHLKKLIGCNQVIIINWKELSDETENEVVERKETVE